VGYSNANSTRGCTFWTISSSTRAKDVRKDSLAKAGHAAAGSALGGTAVNLVFLFVVLSALLDVAPEGCAFVVARHSVFLGAANIVEIVPQEA